MVYGRGCCLDVGVVMEVKEGLDGKKESEAAGSADFCRWCRWLRRGWGGGVGTCLSCNISMFVY